MKLSDFQYQLPNDLIAMYPAENRSASRLLCVCGNRFRHRHFYQLPDLLSPNDLLIFNDSKVIPARLYGHKETGGKIEILIERIIGKTVLAHVKASKSPRIGTRIVIADGITFTVKERAHNLFKLQVEAGIEVLQVLEKFGHIPLPPYIKRQDELSDVSRYQTVYAKHDGSVAAPTAGLHFDNELLSAIKSKGVDIGYVTLHVGAGTFEPVRVEDDITKHRMHSELIDVAQEVCDQIAACKRRKGRVIAVGTTAVRSLETASLPGKLQPCQGESDIFIYPGFKFKTVDAMITNFHLPGSTLLMLVSAFCSLDTVMAAYQEAIRERYRFFSYGDAMFIVPGD